MSNLLMHGATVTVNAPVPEVYQFFTHFDQFPKFLKFVKEVTYLDEQHQRTHWVAHIFGRDEWDAVNEDWIEDQKVGWRSISGLKNNGRIEFLEAGPDRTRIVAEMKYEPPVGVIGQIIDDIAVSNRFDEELMESMNEFAHLVNNAPPGGLDPNSPNYVFGKSDESAQTGDVGVSNMKQAGPGVPQPDKVFLSTTGEMVDVGLTPRDLGTVGGGQTPRPDFASNPPAIEPVVSKPKGTNPSSANVIDPSAKSNLGGRTPDHPQTSMGDRDVDATGSARSSNEDYAHPMTSRHPDKLNQPAEKNDAGKGGDVASKTGASSSEPATDKEQR
jgi:uncharacterized membrane protein